MEQLQQVLVIPLVFMRSDVMMQRKSFFVNRSLIVKDFTGKGNFICLGFLDFF